MRVFITTDGHLVSECLGHHKTQFLVVKVGSDGESVQVEQIHKAYDLEKDVEYTKTTLRVSGDIFTIELACEVIESRYTRQETCWTNLFSKDENDTLHGGFEYGQGWSTKAQEGIALYHALRDSSDKSIIFKS